MSIRRAHNSMNTKAQLWVFGGKYFAAVFDYGHVDLK
jgi:hypothetical protein